jgi:hypothetical protein
MLARARSNLTDRPTYTWIRTQNFKVKGTHVEIVLPPVRIMNFKPCSCLIFIFKRFVLLILVCFLAVYTTYSESKLKHEYFSLWVFFFKLNTRGIITIAAIWDLQTTNPIVRCEVLTAVVMKSTDFRDITPCSPFKVNRRSGGTYRLHLQGFRTSRARNQRESRWQAEPIPRHWRWRRYVSPKRLLTFNRLHAVISLKIVLYCSSITLLRMRNDIYSHRIRFKYKLEMSRDGPYSEHLDDGREGNLTVNTVRLFLRWHLSFWEFFFWLPRTHTGPAHGG